MARLQAPDHTLRSEDPHPAAFLNPHLSVLLGLALLCLFDDSATRVDQKTTRAAQSAVLNDCQSSHSSLVP